MNLNKCLNFLHAHGASGIEHSGEDFLSHLKGTMDLLKNWGAPEHLYLAGLFHSVYGTEVFQDSLIPDGLRPQVKELIGEEAEEIAYLFGIMDRKSFLKLLSQQKDFYICSRFDKEKIAIPKELFQKLCNLYIANRLEQHPRWPNEWKYAEKEEMNLIRAFIYERAILALNKEYHFQK